MSIIGFLFFCLLIWITIKLVKNYIRLNRFRRQWRDMMNQAQQGASAQAASGGQRRERREGWNNDNVKPRRKHFGSEDGEYVAFEEIETDTTVTTETDASGRTTTTIEQETRITDAEWEDIR